MEVDQLVVAISVVLSGATCGANGFLVACVVFCAPFLLVACVCMMKYIPLGECTVVDAAGAVVVFRIDGPPASSLGIYPANPDPGVLCSW